MITISKASISHLVRMTVQEQQLAEIDSVAQGLTMFPWKVILSETNEPLVLFTFVPQSDCNIRLYALVSANIGKYSTSVVKCMCSEIFIQSFTYPRIECTVKTSFEQGHRLMRILGFEKECDMINYFNRESHTLYRRK